jgi:hypothetical protein
MQLGDATARDSSADSRGGAASAFVWARDMRCSIISQGKNSYILCASAWLSTLAQALYNAPCVSLNKYPATSSKNHRRWQQAI